MGKGEILENLGDGKYKVKLIFSGRDRLAAKIAILDAQIAAVQDRIDVEEDPLQLQILTMQKRALEKNKQYLQNNFPDDPEVDIWCTELVDDLSVGLTVGTIEIPGERQTVNLRPAFDDLAAWDGVRDGQLEPAIAGTPYSSLFNQMLFPAWQKWLPTYRLATIKDIDHASSTCSIQLLPARSSQQNLNVNQGAAVEIGKAGTEYLLSDAEVPGWNQFKVDYPAHALVTNSEQPEPVSSTAELVAQITVIVLDVRSKHLYQADPSYKAINASEWNIMTGDDPNPQLNDRGDCEDFALTYADKLINALGLSPRNMQVALCWTQDGSYHANLLVRTTDHGVLVLDNDLISGVMTKEALDSSGYFRWDKFLINGDQWANDSVEILTVPIEYMDCGAAAFGVGSEVVVEFTDQDFEQPKVIGFASNPAGCANVCFSMDGMHTGYSGIFAWNPSSDVWFKRSGDLTSMGYKRFMASFSWGDGIINTIGGMAHIYYLDEFDFIHWTDNASEKNQEYNSPADSILSKNDIPQGKAWQYGAVLNDNEGLFPGGAKQINFEDESGFDKFNGTDTNHKYTRATDAWSTRNNVSQDVFASAVFAIGGKAYVIKGYSNWLVEGWAFFDDAQSFDDPTNSWAGINDPFPKWFLPNAWSANDKGWIAQGDVMEKIYDSDYHINYVPPGNPYGHWITGAHYSYDAVLNSWTTEAKNTASGGFGWLGRGDLSVSQKQGGQINVSLGTGSEGFSGDLYNHITKIWQSTSSCSGLGLGNYRAVGGTVGGAGTQ